MILIFWFLIFFYALLLLTGIVIWSIRDRYRKSPAPEALVSVIIPFRNEEQGLTGLVNSLAAQSHQHFEVIFIDDHSTDNSRAVLEEALAQHTFKHSIYELSTEEGKKGAIAHGISKASGEIILTTDADCEFGAHWIREMMRPFSNAHIQMAAGPVQLQGKGLFRRWQRMEFATLIASGAIMIRTGSPSMANGANLAYRKSAFEAVNGFDSIKQTPSGDDELLMMKVKSQFPKSIVFRKSREALVFTEALSSWSDFEQQRQRWASKWRIGKRRSGAVLALLIFVINLSLLLLPIVYGLGAVSPDDFLTIFRIRFMAEALWVLWLSFFFRGTVSVRAFLLHQVLYPFYVVYFAVKANFGTYHWKGRSYKV